MESRWKRDGQAMIWHVTIPANSYATAVIPVPKAELIKDGDIALAKAPGCTVLKASDNGVEFRLGSGTYQFSFPAPTYAASKLPNK